MRSSCEEERATMLGRWNGKTFREMIEESFTVMLHCRPLVITSCL